MPIATLSELSSGQEADLFLLMTVKEELKTKTGKPYFRVGFRDGGREVSFPIWGDSPWAVDCRDRWNPGLFYKLRAVYRETDFGPQLEIRKIREAVDADAADGFDPTLCLPRSRFDPQAMFDELMAIARQHIKNAALRKLVESLFLGNREALLTHPAARRNHHAYLGGLLEHTLSVTRTCVFLADKYADYYPEMKPPLDKDLVVAGGILHDIGKLREMEQRPEGAAHTAEGSLIGHILIGRDMVREAAAAMPAGAALDGRHAPAAGAPDHHASGPARVGLAQAADDARGPAGAFRRRHRRQVSDDGERAARGHQSRPGHVEEERADAARVPRPSIDK